MDSRLQGAFDANHGQGFHPGLAESRLKYLGGYLANKLPFRASERDLSIPEALAQACERPELRDYALALIAKPVLYAFWRAWEGPIPDAQERRALTRWAWRNLDIGEIAKDIKVSRVLGPESISL